MLKRLIRRLSKREERPEPAVDGRDLVRPLFDASWYLATNLDVATAGLDPFSHYLDHGWGEGRQPNPLFDPAWYLERYPDVTQAGKEPLGHYAESGWREGRLPSPNFDAVAYLASNPDVVAQGMNPLEHYLRHGRDENRPVQGVRDRAEGAMRGGVASDYANGSRWPAETARELIRLAYRGLVDREPRSHELDYYGSALAEGLTGAQMLSVVIGSEEFRNRFQAQRQAAHDRSSIEMNEDSLRNVLAMTQATVQDRLAETGVRPQLGSPSQLDGSAAEIEERIRRLLQILSLEASATRPVQAPPMAA